MYRNIFRGTIIASVAVFVFSASSICAAPLDKTIFKGAVQKGKLIGKHMLSLQWLNFVNNSFGSATIADSNGLLLLKGEQRVRGKEKGYLTVDGRVTEVTTHGFKFTGKIVTSVSSINDGKECIRNGDFNFEAKGGRKYWRLQEMQSPCSEVTDYVDLYF